MRFDEKLKKYTPEEIWQEYCGFLDLSMAQYMDIQHRLLLEQIGLFSGCALGQKLFKGQKIETVEDFRRLVPLTKYEDYADALLMQRVEQLPSKPVVWLKTTWEGGNHPAKSAPYSEAMLNTYKTNIVTALILSTARARGKFRVRPGMKALYTLAPMPYATGLFPSLIDAEIKLNFFPPTKEAKEMSFAQQNKVGFELSFENGMDLFFGMSSIIFSISRNLTSASSGGGMMKAFLKAKPSMKRKMLSAFFHSKRDSRPIVPKDLFDLDGLICVGTDSALYKAELEELWGCRPLEVAGGTEPTCLGTETWSKDGLVFFPDACFYEFIPEREMLRSIEDPSYQPHTYLMDELVANQNYELVITVLKGGAFARYRVGDVYRCLRTKNPADQLDFPQFEYIDRVPNVIDIAGFTRITEKVIDDVITMSRLQVADWIAFKEYDENGHSFMHLCAEMDPDCLLSAPASMQLILEHLSVYFRFYDKDYSDLKKLLGVDPLVVTILKPDTIGKYRRSSSHLMPRINPSRFDVIEILKLSQGS